EPVEVATQAHALRRAEHPLHADVDLLPVGAGQRLVGDDGAGAQVDDGLVRGDHAAVVEELLHHRVPLGGVGGQHGGSGLGDAHPVAAADLGGDQRLLGAAHQLEAGVAAV